MPKRGIIDVPYLDFSVDLDAVQLTPELQSQINEHITAAGGGSLEDDDWERLRFSLAVYIATERARRTQPSDKSAKLRNLKKSAEKHLASLDHFSTEEIDWLLGDIFPAGGRAAYMEQLGRFARMTKLLLDFGNPALELDESLRALFSKLSKVPPTVSHSAAVSDSRYQVFVKLTSGAIPNELLPPESPKTLSRRPKMLEGQRAKQREEAAALSAKIEQVGQSAKVKRAGEAFKRQQREDSGSKGNDS